MARAKPADASSTDWRAAVPFAISLKDAGPAILPDLAKALGAAAPTIEACRAALEDDARTRARFLALPAYQAVAAEVLADVGGEAAAGPLAAEIARRTGMLPTEVPKLLSAAGVASGSVLVLQRTSADGMTRSYSLIAEGVASIARVLRGVTLPRGAPPAEAPGRVDREVRDRVALATLAIHRPLRLTQDRAVHRASLKSFVKGIGKDPEHAERMLARSLRDELLIVARDGQSAALSLPELASVAIAGPSRDLDGACAFVPEDRWVPLEGACRARAARDLPRSAYAYGTRGSFFAQRYRPHDEAQGVRTAAAIEMHEHRGTTWIRRRAARPGVEETGDGHVTPSYDVMLGPGASLSVVAQVGLGAALTRIDQVLTFHIGPRTVEAGLAAGMDPAAFVAALGRVGRHGLPDNVRVMVDDWVKSAKFARAESVLLVRVSERATAAVAEALGEHCVGTLGPGRIVAGPRSARSAITEKLRRLSMPVELPEEWAKDDAPPYRYTSDPHPFEPHLPPFPEADPAIVARHDAAQANGFAADLALLAAPPRPATPPKPDRAPPPGEGAPATAGGIPELALAKAHTLAAPLFDAQRAEIAAWTARLGPHEAREAARAPEYPLLLAPLLALLPEYRARAYKRAPSFGDLLDEAWRLCGGTRRSRAGVDLMQAVARSSLQKEDFTEAAAWLDEVDDDEDADSPLPRFARRGSPAGKPPPPAASPHAPAQAAAPAPVPPAPAKPAATKAAAPAPKPTRPQSPNAIRAWMISASKDERAVRIEVGSRTSTVRVTAMRTRGHETMFLVVDTETDEGRALPLEAIRSVAYADG